MHELSIAMNEMFKEEWLYEDADKLFEPPVNMVTEIGSEVLKRMRFIRDEYEK